MFPSHQGNELMIQFCSSPHQLQQDISEDLILDDYASMDISDSNKRLVLCWPKKFIHGPGKNHGHHSGEYKKNKMIHRDIERQRRQEMATLYASLRSFLPFELIKGKLSISNHVNVAVNYIKYLQKNMIELNGKRNELKKLSYSNLENHEIERTSSGLTIHENSGRVGIEINSAFGEEPLPISKLLELLLEEGL